MTIPELSPIEKSEILRLYRAAGELAAAIERRMAGCPYRQRRHDLHRAGFHTRKTVDILGGLCGIDALATEIPPAA
jgi:hypothetical protein